MAIKYREEALPKVSTFPFDISHWAGVNKLSGGQRDYEMADCVNMSVDNYPYASPRKPRNKILAEEGVQRIYKVEDDRAYYIDGENQLCVAEKGVKSYVLTEGNRKQMHGCICTNNYDKGTFFYPNMCYLNENNEIECLNSGIVFGGIKDSGFEYSCTGFVYIENIDVTTFKIKADFTGIIFPTSRYNTEVNVRMFLCNKDGERKSLSAFDMVYYPIGGYNFGYNKPIPADPRIMEWEVNFQGWLGTNVTVEEGDYLEFLTYHEHYEYYSESFAMQVVEGVKNAEWSIVETEEAKLLCDKNLNYGVVYNNRIVGVKGNEIRASALGDFTNFWEYADEAGNPSATGAYTTNVGSAGDFTGICVYNNMIMLFKKDLVYEMYGSMPYTIMELCTTGCIDNDSICEIGGVLYWASPKGIVRYSGGMPTVISHTVDIDTSGICKAGTDGRKYYVFDGKRLYVYDTYYQMWHIEEAEDVKMLYKDINTVYILCNDGIYKINDGDEAVEWEFETKDFTFGSPERKNLSKLWIRTEMERQSTLEVYVRQDGGEWERKAVKTAERDEMFDFKLRIKKCDSFAIKFKGKSKAKILDIHGKVTVGTSKHRSGASLNVYR